jgi:hypothetical protein
MKIKIVSTFSDKGFKEYGKNFVESCKQFIDPRIEVVVYIDDVNINPTGHVNALKLEQSIPNVTEFKNRNSYRTGFKDFRWDGVRFCYKSYVMCHAAKDPSVDVLIWLDADTTLLRTITPEYLTSFLPREYFVGFLGRKGAPETGFLIFNLRHAGAKPFFDKFEWYYNSDEVYKLEQYHDAWVFQELKNELEANGTIRALSITKPGELKHPFNGTFKDYMIHFKGESKGKINK